MAERREGYEHKIDWPHSHNLPIVIVIVPGCLSTARITHYEGNGLVLDFPSIRELSAKREFPAAFSISAEVVLRLRETGNLKSHFL